jgi:hypothetical protein
MKVLNVGGGGSRKIPAQFDGWEQVLLDINPEVKPDVCLDAKEIGTLPENEYDAVYCSHTLEHFYKHEVQIVLKGFLHVLKPGGFAEVSVPDIRKLMDELISRNHDIDDVFYRAEYNMPITFHDVLYGWGQQVSSGNVFYAHKCGFTALSLATALEKAGFGDILQSIHDSNIYMKAFKKE